jgi:hypothetical protein
MRLLCGGVQETKRGPDGDWHARRRPQAASGPEVVRCRRGGVEVDHGSVMRGASSLFGASGPRMTDQAGMPGMAVAPEQPEAGQQRWLRAGNSDPRDELHGEVTARAQQQQRSVTVVCGLELGGDLPSAGSIPRVPPSFPVRGLVACLGAIVCPGAKACLGVKVGSHEPLS